MSTRPSPLARLAARLRRAVSALAGRRRRYRPEKHYMRGGGPRSAERRGEAAGGRPTGDRRSA